MHYYKTLYIQQEHLVQLEAQEQRAYLLPEIVSYVMKRVVIFTVKNFFQFRKNR